MPLTPLKPSWKSPFVSTVRGIGSYVPQKCVTNDDLSHTLETSHEWIVTRTGIHQRFIAEPDQVTSDLAVEAGQQALMASCIGASDIDLLILATSTPDHTFPATATRVQEKLNIYKGAAFDIGAVCSGFIFALATADAYIGGGLAKNVLVIGAETMSRVVDWTDRRTAVLFGDGAGAVVLSSAQRPENLPYSGIIGSVLHTDGRGYDHMHVSGGPSTTQTTGKILMSGNTVFKHAVSRMGDVAEEILQRHNLDITDVDWIIPHQANQRIIQAMAERLKYPSHKIIFTGSMHANTSAASIPLAWHQGVKDGRIKPGQLVLCEAFAAGFAWGATLIRL